MKRTNSSLLRPQLFLMVLVACLLVACASVMPAAAPTATPLPTATPTVTPLPTEVPPVDADLPLDEQRAILFERLDLEGAGANLQPAELLVPPEELGAAEGWAFTMDDPYAYFAFYLVDVQDNLDFTVVRHNARRSDLLHPEGTMLTIAQMGTILALSHHYHPVSDSTDYDRFFPIYRVYERLGAVDFGGGYREVNVPAETVRERRERLFSSLELIADEVDLQPAEPLLPAEELEADEVWAYELHDPYVSFSFYIYGTREAFDAARERVREQAKELAPEGAVLVRSINGPSLMLAYYYSDGSRGDPVLAEQQLNKVGGRFRGEH